MGQQKTYKALIYKNIGALLFVRVAKQAVVYYEYKSFRLLLFNP
jgi:hypothetical protein